MISSNSHVPVLVALATKCPLGPIRRVLELGAGVYSRDAFMINPLLEKYDILENGEPWYHQAILDAMTASPLTRSCATVYYRQMPMVDYVQQFDLEHYDLVFVDDSVTVADRMATIDYVTRTAKRPVVVVHDVEVGAYQQSIHRQGRQMVIFDHAEPCTAVLWSGQPAATMQSIRDQIGALFAANEAATAEQWKELLA